MNYSEIKQALGFEEEERKLVATEEPDRNAIPLGDFFDALQNRRRREVIRHFEDEDIEKAHQNKITNYIVEREGIEMEEVPDEYEKRRKSVYATLYQTHIPKLEEIGIVETENDDRTIIRPGHAYETAHSAVFEEDARIEGKNLLGDSEFAVFNPEARYITLE